MWKTLFPSESNESSASEGGEVSNVNVLTDDAAATPPNVVVSAVDDGDDNSNRNDRGRDNSTNDDNKDENNCDDDDEEEDDDEAFLSSSLVKFVAQANATLEEQQKVFMQMGKSPDPSFQLSTSTEREFFQEDNENHVVFPTPSISQVMQLKDGNAVDGIAINKELSESMYEYASRLGLTPEGSYFITTRAEESQYTLTPHDENALNPTCYLSDMEARRLALEGMTPGLGLRTPGLTPASLTALPGNGVSLDAAETPVASSFKGKSGGKRNNDLYADFEAQANETTPTSEEEYDLKRESKLSGKETQRVTKQQPWPPYVQYDTNSNETPSLADEDIDECVGKEDKEQHILHHQLEVIRVTSSLTEDTVTQTEILPRREEGQQKQHTADMATQTDETETPIERQQLVICTKDEKLLTDTDEQRKKQHSSTLKNTSCSSLSPLPQSRATQTATKMGYSPHHYDSLHNTSALDESAVVSDTSDQEENDTTTIELPKTVQSLIPQITPRVDELPPTINDESPQRIINQTKNIHVSVQRSTPTVDKPTKTSNVVQQTSPEIAPEKKNSHESHIQLPVKVNNEDDEVLPNQQRVSLASTKTTKATETEKTSKKQSAPLNPNKRPPKLSSNKHLSTVTTTTTTKATTPTAKAKATTEKATSTTAKATTATTTSNKHKRPQKTSPISLSKRGPPNKTTIFKSGVSSQISASRAATPTTRVSSRTPRTSATPSTRTKKIASTPHVVTTRASRLRASSTSRTIRTTNLTSTRASSTTRTLNTPKTSTTRASSTTRVVSSRTSNSKKPYTPAGKSGSSITKAKDSATDKGKLHPKSPSTSSLNTPGTPATNPSSPTSKSTEQSRLLRSTVATTTKQSPPKNSPSVEKTKARSQVKATNSVVRPEPILGSRLLKNSVSNKSPSPPKKAEKSTANRTDTSLQGISPHKTSNKTKGSAGSVKSFASVSSRLMQSTAASQSHVWKPTKSPTKSPAKSPSVEEAQAKARERIRQRKLREQKQQKNNPAATRKATGQSKVFNADEGIAKAKERLRQRQLQQKSKMEEKSRTKQRLTARVNGRENSNKVRVKNKDTEPISAVSSATKACEQISSADAKESEISGQRPVISESNVETTMKPSDRKSDEDTGMKEIAVPQESNDATTMEQLKQQSDKDTTRGTADDVKTYCRDEDSVRSCKRPLTVPKEPQLATTAKYGDKKPTQKSKEDVTLAQNSDVLKKCLRDSSPASLRSGGKQTLTVPQEPHFVTREKLGDKRPVMGQSHISLARSTEQFSHVLRDSSPSTARSGERPLTIPQEPHFVTTAKYGNKKPPQKLVTDNTLAQSAELFSHALRQTSPSSVNSDCRTSLTVPKEPRFVTTAKYGDKKPPQKMTADFTLAQSAEMFSHVLRDSGSPHSLRSMRSDEGSSLTIPQEPHFATTAKYGNKKPPKKLQTDVTLAQSDEFFSHVLRDGSPASVASRTSAGSSEKRSLTIPIEPKFATNAKYGKRETPRKLATDVTLAQSADVFSHVLRDSSPSVQSLNRGLNKLTVPHSPKFHNTHKRSLPKSEAEKVEELMEFFRSHPFKANPVLKHFDGGFSRVYMRPPKAGKRRLTTPEPFKLRSVSRSPASTSSAREIEDLEECKKQFHARPLPDFTKSMTPGRRLPKKKSKESWKTPEAFKEESSPGQFRARPLPQSTYQAQAVNQNISSSSKNIGNSSVSVDQKASQRNAEALARRRKVKAIKRQGKAKDIQRRHEVLGEMASMPSDNEKDHHMHPDQYPAKSDMETISQEEVQQWHHQLESRNQGQQDDASHEMSRLVPDTVFAPSPYVNKVENNVDVISPATVESLIPPNNHAHEEFAAETVYDDAMPVPKTITYTPKKKSSKQKADGSVNPYEEHQREAFMETDIIEGRRLMAEQDMEMELQRQLMNEMKPSTSQQPSGMMSFFGFQ